MLGTPAVVKSVTETRQAGTAIIHAFIDRSVATFLDASSLHTYIYSTSPSSAFGTVKVNIHTFMELGLLFEGGRDRKGVQIPSHVPSASVLSV